MKRMCVSLTASIVAAIVNATCCAYLRKRGGVGDHFLSISLGYIGSMQWLEAVMHADPECGPWNTAATRVAQWQNAFQPLVFVLCARYVLRDSFQDIMFVPFLCCAYLVFPKILEAEPGCARPCSTNAEGLSWEYTRGLEAMWILFALSLSVPMLAIPGVRGQVFATLNLLIYAISIVIARHRCGENSEVAAGSIWCMLGAVLPVVAVAWTPPKRHVETLRSGT